jgi:hypothetical protein
MTNGIGGNASGGGEEERARQHAQALDRHDPSPLDKGSPDVFKR